MRAMTGTGRRWCGLLAGAAFACAGAAAPVSAEDPMAAIDWLRETLVAPELGELHPVTPPEDADDDAITMRPLDQVRPDAVGLFPAERVGLARDFWGPRTAGELAPLVAALPVDTLPALRVLAYRLLLAEFEAPAGADETEGSPLLAARGIDKLYEYGALDQALAVLETLDSREAGMKLRWLEIALLLGDEEPVCARVLARGTEFPFEPGRIYCLARSGDWDAAEEAWDAAEDGLPEPYDALLARFLEVEGHYEAEPFAPGALPAQLSPLAWRMLEAIGRAGGDAWPAGGLCPCRSARHDRLARADRGGRAAGAHRRAGAEPAAGPLYRARGGGLGRDVGPGARGAAAGRRADPARCRGGGRGAGVAWERMAGGRAGAGAGGALRRGVARPAAGGRRADVARSIGYLSDDYEAVALDEAGTGPRLRRLAAVARGLPPDPGMPATRWRPPWPRPSGTGADAAEDAPDRLAEGSGGRGAAGADPDRRLGSDPRMLAEGLALLRHLGFEDIARRAALQALMLDRRG
jgi:hypothetical protein